MSFWETKFLCLMNCDLVQRSCHLSFEFCPTLLWAWLFELWMMRTSILRCLSCFNSRSLFHLYRSFMYSHHFLCLLDMRCLLPLVAVSCTWGFFHYLSSISYHLLLWISFFIAALTVILRLKSWAFVYSSLRDLLLAASHLQCCYDSELILLLLIASFSLPASTQGSAKE